VTARPTVRYPFTIIRERLRAHPGPVLDFAFGEYSEPPPPAVLKTLTAEPEAALQRCTADEMGAFVETASAFLSDLYEIDTSDVSILPMSGGRLAMSALVASLVRPDDAVLVTEPTYPAFARVASQHRGRILTALLDPGRGFDPDLRQLSDDDVGPMRIFGLNYPNNPTGALATARAVTDLVRHTDRRTVWFNDATYGPLTFEQPCHSLLASEDLRGQTVVELHSMAKVYALGPLSVAFLVGECSVVEDVREYSEFASAPMSTLQVRAARLCLTDADRVRRVGEATRERVMRLGEVLTDLGFEAYPPRAGQYLLCRLPGAIGDQPVASAEEAAASLLAQHGLAVMPWDVGPSSYLRFSGMYLPKQLEALRRSGKLATD
jgi:LL-diaminopimelate aminotransferase